MYTGRKVWIIEFIEPEREVVKEEKDSWFGSFCDSLLDGALDLASSITGTVSVGASGIKFSIGLKDN